MGEGIKKQGVNTHPNKHRMLPHTRTSTKKVRAVTKATRPDRDIYGGKSAQLVSALRKQEEAWGKEQSTIEKARVYDVNGHEVYRNDNGTPTSVAVNNIARIGNVTTHIHPKQNGNDMAAQIGLPLSGADVKNAITWGAKETRAVAAGYTYSLRPKDGKNWGITPRQFQIAYNRAMKEYTDNVIIPVLRNRLTNGRIFGEEEVIFNNRANLAQQNYALKKVAKKYGLIYTRRKR